jgi:hypothetical protein
VISFRFFMMWAGLFIFSSLLISILISAYMAHTKLDNVLKAMQDAPDAKLRTPWPGLKGKVLQLAHLSGIIAFPKSAIKAGSATAMEIERIPKAFKTQIVILYNVKIVIFIMMIMYGIAAEMGLANFS